VSAKNEKDIGMNKMNFAVSKMNGKNYKEALVLFLDCFDNADKYEASFMSIKNSFLIIYLKKMMKYYPPTREALNNRYLAMKRKIESGNFNIQEVNSIYELAKSLDKLKDIVPSYDIARKGVNKGKKLRFLTNLFYKELYKSGRYKTIYDNLDLINFFKSTINKSKKVPDMIQNYYKDIIIKTYEEYKNIYKQVKDEKKTAEITKIYSKYKNKLL
jgi:hypothetical protein